MTHSLRSTEDGTKRPARKEIHQNVEAAFHDYWDELRSYLRRRTGDGNTGDDLAQDVLLHYSVYEYPIRDVRSFLFRTARNLVNNWSRDRKQERAETITIESRTVDGTGTYGNEPFDTREALPDARIGVGPTRRASESGTRESRTF
jgi:DNA-directed RNA polymerase specialized sigma24 family protein